MTNKILIPIIVSLGLLCCTILVAAGYTISRMRAIDSAIAFIDSIGGAVGVDGSTLGGPYDVTLKLQGVKSDAFDERLVRGRFILDTLRDVRSLNLSGSPIGDVGAAVLFKCWGESIRHVDLSDSRLASYSLVAAARLKQIERIETAIYLLDGEAFAALAESSSLRRVKFYECGNENSDVQRWLLLLQERDIEVVISERRSLTVR